MTTAAQSDRVPLTNSQIARHFDVDSWVIPRLFERKLLDEPARFGRYRLLYEDDLPRIGEALRRGGYLRTEPEPMTA